MIFTEIIVILVVAFLAIFIVVLAIFCWSLVILIIRIPWTKHGISIISTSDIFCIVVKRTNSFRTWGIFTPTFST